MSNGSAPENSSQQKPRIDSRQDAVSAVFAWLFNQRPEVILLFVLVIGGGWFAQVQFPQWIMAVEAGFERNHVAFGEKLKIVVDAFEKDQLRDAERSKQTQQNLDDLIRTLRAHRINADGAPIVQTKPN